jgi:hypothetical protein
MAKASKDINRRTLIRAGGTAIMVVPTLPVAAAAGVSRHADEKLLAFGVQLEELIAEWMVEMARDRKRADDIEDRVEKATGVAWDSDNPRDEAYLHARSAIIVKMDAEEEPEAEDKWTKFHARIYPVIDAINEETAKTLAGLAVQARAFSLNAYDCWENMGLAKSAISRSPKPSSAFSVSHRSQLELDSRMAVQS